MKKNGKRVAGRVLLFSGGSLSLGLGIIGIFLPVLPTTPFLILAAFLFAKSSRRIHYWILHNRLFGRYIRNYVSGRGMAPAAKLLVIAVLWVTICLSALLAVSTLWVRIVLFAVAVGVSIHILTIPTLKKGEEDTP
ncbi:MAG: YbaN family protein [Spirochaetes bacterium]|nr:YbaN family protein [Spirochaetota bacterium]